MKVMSLFAGIGGIDLGFDLAGHETVGQVEWDDAARTVLEQHWPGVPRWGDIQEVSGDDLPIFDVLTGGFPCQDISVAGHRKGLDGSRSRLWWEFARVIRETTPRWILIENVTGLLSSNDGADLGAILGTLEELGYGWAYRTLDAQYFGVAQRRRRVFIVGHLGGPGAGQVLFEPESCEGDSAPRREAGAIAAGELARSLSNVGGGNDYGANKGPLVANTLTAGADGKAGRRSEDDTNLVSYGLSENQRGELRLTDYARSIGVGGGKPGQGYPATLTGGIVRRLTPRECERLQGFPDDWTASLSDTQRYKTLGNAVAVPVARWIGSRMGANPGASSLTPPYGEVATPPPL